MTFAELRPVLAHLERVDRPHWISGGWAVDLHIGRVTRAHDDVDVLVPARDVPVVLDAFPTLVRVDEQTGERTPLADTDLAELLPGRHTLAFPAEDAPAGPPVQLILAATDGDEWVFHRGKGRIRMPLAEIGLITEAGMPYLVPELVLLFKSRGNRPKDEADFQALAPTLEPERLRWLLDRLPPNQPNHPWREWERATGGA